MIFAHVFTLRAFLEKRLNEKEVGYLSRYGGQAMDWTTEKSVFDPRLWKLRGILCSGYR